MPQKSKKVLVIGTFREISYEMISFLKKARSLGDSLTVAVMADSMAMKRTNTLPYVNEKTRCSFLEQIKLVDEVVIYRGEFEDAVGAIAFIKPDVVAMRGEALEAEKQFCKEAGIELVEDLRGFTRDQVNPIIHVKNNPQ